MERMKLYTIGFAGKPAEFFFALLQKARVRTVIDVRLNNVSQLAGFAKRDDLRYFLRSICDCGYVHMPLLAPSADLRDAYRQGSIDWSAYDATFKDLMKARQIQEHVDRTLLDHACLLCSEHLPDKCHRRLVAEYLATLLDLDIEHLF